MRIRIRKADDGSLINVIDLKEQKTGGSFGYIRRIEAMQAGEDILKAGKLGMADLGISSLTFRDGVTTSSEKGTASYIERRNSMIASPALMDLSSEMDETDELTIGGEGMGMKVMVEMYRPGWVLGIGKQSTNIFGGSYAAYLKSIGTRNISSSNKNGAKAFATQKALLAYIEKHRKVMEYCVREYGYNWSAELTCALFKEDFDEESQKMPPARRAKALQASEEIARMLEEIDSAAADSDGLDIEDIPDAADDDSLRAEALHRMQKLRLWDLVIRGFAKEGKIFRSEFGGAVYDLDEEAEKAVEKVREDGHMPYHVVLTHTQIGDMYSVLYVSKETSEWPYERPDRDGVMRVYVRNASEPMFSEYGSSQYAPANGGLRRVA